MTSIKHKSSLNAARELCINEKMVSSDMNAIAHERSRLIIITFATTMLWVVMALIVDHTNTKQAFLSSAGFNAVTGVMAVVFLVWLVIGSIKYSDRK